ncbi:oligosaccharide flippase family protein [Sphingobacterium thermophilum]|uniref:Polysaccharide biosynthesis protein n=1 Tax=Sphingobacterium thermophilum TaxID=768534 RepID=A0ABP8R096_9SPHI
MSNLKQNVSWMLIGNVFYAFAQWLQLTIIAKWSEVEILGNFTLYLSIVAPVFMFTNLQLRAVQVTDSVGKWRFSDFFTLRVISCLLSIVIVAIISLIINPKNVFQLFIIVFLKILEGFSEIFNSRQQLNEQMKNVAISFILKGVAVVLGTFLGYFIFDSLSIGLLISLFFVLLVVLYNDYYLCRPIIREKSLVKLNIEKLKALFITSLPLAVVMLIISLNTNVLKYFVEHFLGTAYQGLYSTLSYLLVMGNFIIAAVGQSFIPKLSKLYDTENYRAFKSLSRRFILISFAVGVLTFLISFGWGKQILVILFNKEIANYYKLFQWIMFSGIFMYLASSLGYIMTAMKIFKPQPFINAFVLLLNLVLGFVFIRKFGINGVVYSLIIVFIVQIAATQLLISKALCKK